MARTIAGVVIGYIVMVAGIFVSFSIFYLIIGASAAFQTGSYEATSLWLGGSFVLGLVAAVLGGIACLAVAREGRAATVLAVFVIVLGLIMAFAATGEKVDLGSRDGDVGLFEAMSKASQPVWVGYLNPFIGAIGVLIAARIRPARASA